MSNEYLLSKTIKYLRFPLTVGVILIHFNLARDGMLVHGVKYGYNYSDLYFYTCVFFSDVLACICVPAFFVISGFLFFYKKEFNRHVYEQKLKSRFRTLLIPYILWNLIAVLCHLMKMLPIFSSFFPNANSTEISFSIVRVFNTFFYNDGYNGLFISPAGGLVAKNPIPINGPMWYIRDLMVMVLLSPVIYWLIKKAGGWFVIILGIIQFLFSRMIFPNGGYLSLLLNHIIFFVWGAYYSIKKQDMVSEMRKYRYVPLLFAVLAIVDTFTINLDLNKYLYVIVLLTGIVSVIVVTSYLLEKGKIHVNETLANSSFFIFALHTLIINDIGKVLFVGLHLPDTPLAMLFLYVTVPFLTIVLCLLLYKLLNRYTPWLCHLLTGGRN